ncbi:MAG: ECF transporter S component [Corynebacterium sp.]|uniref:ECF transporter S component n=1 Tax=Corynebacterium sp. TaxID=1720 RepID=UPI0026DB2C69|nr:ECF transporter S component [Corynebacterium sp.]MDO4762211.1 ECF transporter S component [Corynebacterium sp.]
MSHKILLSLGCITIAATWCYLVLTRPVEWDSTTGSNPALITLIGYTVGAVLLIAATIPKLRASTISLIPLALVLNIIPGQLTGSLGVPLYLDSIGTVLVAALAGPIAGLATGVMSCVVWALFNPAALPFAGIAGLVGLLAGLVLKNGTGTHIIRVILGGLAVGVITACFAAPVAAFVYGGTAGVGTGAMVALFREMGSSLLQAVTLQSLVSDPLDKALVFFIVWSTLHKLPTRLRPQA